MRIYSHRRFPAVAWAFKMNMKLPRDTLFVFLLACLLVNAGCQRESSSQSWAARVVDGTEAAAAFARYAPDKLDIAPLTEYLPADRTHPPHVDLYVSLLDPFGSQIKAPGRFRFELYEHVQRSSEPKGKRIAIWPHIDLTDPSMNNKYWRDFLRAYQFTLPLDRSSSKSQILQVTYFSLTGKRLTSEFTLKNTD